MDSKITYPLFILTKTCMLKMHVKLVDEEGKPQNFNRIYNGEYVHLNLDAFLTFEFKEGEWDKSKSIILHKRNIVHFIKGLKKAIRNIYLPDTFYIEDGETKISSDSIKENTVYIYNLGANQRIVIQPSVIYEQTEDTYYEGVTIYINQSSNYIQIPLDVLEAFVYQLDKLNIDELAFRMVDFYVNHLIDGRMIQRNNVNYGFGNGRPSVFVEDEAESTIIEAPKKQERQSDADFFGL